MYKDDYTYKGSWTANDGKTSHPGIYCGNNFSKLYKLVRDEAIGSTEAGKTACWAVYNICGDSPIKSGSKKVH